MGVSRPASFVYRALRLATIDRRPSVRRRRGRDDCRRGPPREGIFVRRQRHRIVGRRENEQQEKVKGRSPTKQMGLASSGTLQWRTRGGLKQWPAALSRARDLWRIEKSEVR